MYFPNYGLRNMWLDNCVKSPVSEDPSRSKMRNGTKQLGNLKDSAFTIFIDHCEDNQDEKSLS